MKTKKGSSFLKFTTALGFLAMLIMGLQPVYRLDVSSEGRFPPFLSFPVSSGDRFSIRFLHSYDRAFFQENYSVSSDAKILLHDLTFKSHLNGGGFAYPNFHLRSDGVGELREIHEAREKIQFMMGSKDLADHQLLFKGKTYRLSDRIKPFEIVEIRLEKRIVLWDLFVRITSSL